MKKLFLFLLFILLVGCQKEGSGHSDIPSSYYQLSHDGLTLVKWKDQNLSYIDMQADSKLREINTIADEAFKGCKNLKGITLSDNLKEIGVEAFAQTDLSEGLHFYSYSNVVFGEKTFYQSNLREVMLPNTKALPNRIFADCKQLKKVTFAKTKLIGDGALWL